MTITQLYKTYKIMPALQTHMLRVSGVAYRILKEHTVKDDFSNAKLNYESNDLGKQICVYSDMRVKPGGVVSLSDRLHDGRKRCEANEQFFEKMSSYMMKIESELFESIPASPEEITDENVTQTIQQFLSKARFRSQ